MHAGIVGRLINGCSMYIRVLVMVILCGFFSACTGNPDGIEDETVTKAIYREAMCVASAERLQLYDMAEKHRRHGEEYENMLLREVISRDEKGIFERKIAEACINFIEMSKMFHAVHLTERCGERIRVDYIDRIN